MPMLEIAAARPALPATGALVLPAAEEEAFTALGEGLLDAASREAVAKALLAAEFRPKVGAVASLLAPNGTVSRLLVVGLGKRAALGRQEAERAGAAAAVALAQESAAAVAGDSLSPPLLVAFATGALSRSYRFDRYRRSEKPEEKPRLARLALLTAELEAVRALLAAEMPVLRGVMRARDLVSEPGNVLTPAAFAERCSALEQLGLAVEVLGPKALARLRFGALLGVAQGSANPPRLVVLRWPGQSGGKSSRPGLSQPVAFIGKGVTFDSGGISLKPGQGMEEMKFDMAGAAAVVGTMAALAERHAKVDAVGLLGLVENMPSGTAQRPGDVVTTRSGQTVEVVNTDAEGRLVLADLLCYCQQKLKPRWMIDLATLTGAIVVALGHERAGLFSNDDPLAAALLRAGEAVGERLWRMPLGEAYDALIKSDIADMKNSAGRDASAITAAQFLQRFVAGTPWAHLDIAGTAWTDKDTALVPKGASGFGVRLLSELVAAEAEARAKG
jgi:leucyl aminopeptidase